MQAKIKQGALVAALGKVAHAVSSSAANVNPAFAHIKLNAGNGNMAFSATNGELAISSTVREPNCSVEEEGEMIIPASLLIKLASSLPQGEVILQSKAGDLLKISADCGVAATLKCADPAIYPKANNGGDFVSLSLPSSALRDLFRKVSYAQSKDQTRPALKGILMRILKGDIICVATNGRILAEAKHEIKHEGDCPDLIDLIIPTSSASGIYDCVAANGEGDTTIKVAQNRASRNYAVFEGEDVVLRTSLIAAIFPAYSKIIPAPGENIATISRENLLSAVVRASILSPAGESGYILLSFAENQVRIASQKSEAGSIAEAVAAKYNGQKIGLAVADRYLIPILRSIDDDEIQIHVYASDRPIMVTGASRSLALMMPMLL